LSASIDIQRLLDDFVKEIPDLNAALVVDFNGFVIAKKSIKKFDDELIGGIMTLLDQTLNRIKGITQSELGSGSFDIDQFRLFYIQLGKSTGALLVLIGNPYSHLDIYMPYAHIIADKISLILSDCSVSCSFPSLNEKGNLNLKKNSKNIIIIGSEAVGKTALARRCCDDSIIEKHHPTIGISIIEKEFNIDDKNSRILNFFDLSSLHSFAKVRRFFYNYADVVFIIFDYSRIETLNDLKMWIEEARQFIDDTKIPFLIIGNKLDLIEDREVIKNQAQEIAKKYDYMFFETSLISEEINKELMEYLLTEKVDGKKILATPITSEFISKLSEDERIVFISNIDSLDEAKIPNVVEKNIIKSILKHKEISLAVLITKLSPLEKALNRKIDRSTILKVTEKYAQKGQIKKQYLKFDAELESFKNSKTIQKGDM
jgi:small GTP-binding protein